MTLSYKLRYNRDAGEYLNEVHFKELLQWITTETMLAVAAARNTGDDEALVRLENPSDFIYDLVASRVEVRNSANTPIEDDLALLSFSRAESFARSSTTRWAPRPGTASAARPGTALAQRDSSASSAARHMFVGGTGAAARPQTAPAGLAGTMRTLREEKNQFKTLYELELKKVAELRARLHNLKKHAAASE
mmetsp:Transcript_13144/g.31888  ORF Transcript_13144/g.31888 Transcript_13144/m.31888 type:complete len:192 (-) Transcript_13144:36-611(-)